MNQRVAGAKRGVAISRRAEHRRCDNLRHPHEDAGASPRTKDTARVRRGGLSRSDGPGTKDCEVSAGRGGLLTGRPRPRHQVRPEGRDQALNQLFNSSEKRLARTLLLLARYGQTNPQRTLPKISQETLAEMIGATRSRVNFFMNKFRKLGLIEYNGALKINISLLSIVLHD